MSFYFLHTMELLIMSRESMTVIFLNEGAVVGWSPQFFGGTSISSKVNDRRNSKNKSFTTTTTTNLLQILSTLLCNITILSD